MSIVLQIARRVYDDMVAHARAELPNECCGLLAGQLLPDRALATACYALANTAASPVRYDADPRGLFAAFKDMRARGAELLAIYHSHPTTDPVPSRTDLERNFYGPEVVHLIVSLRAGEPEVRAWRLGEASYSEAAWQLVV